jgi:hypothetical protein
LSISEGYKGEERTHLAKITYICQVCAGG